MVVRLRQSCELTKHCFCTGVAEPLIRRAISIGKASFGEGHPSVAIRLNNLALLLQDTNRFLEAEPLMRRALSIDEASFGSEHPTVAADLNNLAILLQTTNRLAEAEPLMRRALSIIVEFQKSTGFEHPNRQASLANYQNLLKQAGKSNKEIEVKIAELLHSD